MTERETNAGGIRLETQGIKVPHVKSLKDGNIIDISNISMEKTEVNTNIGIFANKRV